MKVIHYICHYNALDRQLEIQPSGITKINYIKSALKQAGFRVKLCSVAEGSSSKSFFYPTKYLLRDDLEEEYYISTWGRINIFLKIFSRIWMLIQLLFYLITKVSAGEYVLVYHSLAYGSLFSIYRKWINKNCKLIYEVEEIYTAVSQKSEQSISYEIESLRNIATGYILVNDIMAAECHFKGRKAVCYGTYELSSTKVKCILDNQLIHIVYAGVIGGLDSDAFLAVKIAKYLSPQYVIHLLGYGNDDNILLLKNTICSMNRYLTYEGVKYEGCLKGEEYVNFLAKCQIGLCTRILEDKYSIYTFPSKVMVYMVNNLVTVCTPISCVKKSRIGDAVIISKDCSASSIADSILSINYPLKIDNKMLIKKMHSDFLSQLVSLFSK